MLNRPLLPSLGAALLLAACASPSDRGPDAPLPAYPAGITARLVQQLTIPPGAATVRLQYGHPVASNGVQETDPYCIFELDTVSEAAQGVAPETFPVTRVQRRVTSFSGMPVVFKPALAAGAGRDGGPSQIYYITEFRLRSDSGTRARALTCQHEVSSTPIPHHLTLSEMRQALGDYFVLDLPR